MSIKIPEGMLNAASEAIYKARGGLSNFYAISATQVRDVTLEAAICWLDGELEKLVQHPYPTSGEFYIQPSIAEDYGRRGNNKAIESIRRMYLAPEPEVPKEVKDLLVSGFDVSSGETDSRILEAYRRGKESK